MPLPDDHMQKREAEKAIAIAEIDVLLCHLQDERREPDAWERVHLVYAFLAFFAGCYGLAITEARRALSTTEQRSPHANLPTDSIFTQCDLRRITELRHAAQAEPATELPHFGPVTLPPVFPTQGKSWIR